MPEELKTRGHFFLPGYFFWRPKACCQSLRQWHLENRAELERNRVVKYVELPGDGCCGYVAELRDAKVIGDMKLASTAEDVVLGDLQFLHGAKDPEHHWVLEQIRFRLPQQLPGTAMLLEASNGDNYYHWLFDSLPRLHLLELAGYAYSDVDHFLLKCNASPFQTQSLNLLGILPDRHWHCSKRKILKVDRLLAPSMPGAVFNPPPWVCRFLRRRFLPPAATAPRRNIYISRRFSKGRKLVNESQILPLLAQHGYEVVHAEQLTFSAQVELFASAKKIIALHGAGLANLVFAPPGARVMELCSPWHFNACFSTLAASCDLHHDRLGLFTAEGLPKDKRLANLVVDAEEFRRKFEQFDSR